MTVLVPLHGENDGHRSHWGLVMGIIGVNALTRSAGSIPAGA